MLEELKMELELVDGNYECEADDFMWDQPGLMDAMFAEQPGAYDYWFFIVDNGNDLYWTWQLREWDIEDGIGCTIIEEFSCV